MPPRRWAALVVALVLTAPEASMATDWNPNDTTTVGMETFFTAQGDQLIAGGAAVAVAVPSTAAETIDSVSPYLVGASDDDVRLLLEVFAAGDEVPTDSVTTSTFYPTDDLQIGGADSESSAWIEGSTSGGLGSIGTTNLYAAIDEASLDVDDWIAYNGSRAARKRYRLNIGTSGANWPANRRVVGGRLRITLNRESTQGRLEVGYYNGTSTYRLGSVTAGPQRRTVTVPFPEYNPATGLPWTRAQIQDLASTAGFQLRPAGVGKQKRLRVYRVAVELDWVTESRVAVGVATVDATTAPASGAFVPFTLSVPNSGADNWAKSDATDYVMVLRRISGLGQVGWRWLGETAEVAAALGRPAAGAALPLSAYVPTMGDRGMVSSLGDAVPGRAQTLYMTKTSAAVGVDGQPYAYLSSDITPSSGVGRAQEFTPAASASVSVIRVLMGVVQYNADTMLYEPGTDAQAADLDDMTFRIRRRATDVQVGSTGTVTAADYLASPVVGSDGLRLVEVVLDTPAAVTTAQHYIEFDTTQVAGSSTGDALFFVSAPAAPSDAEVATFGGATDSAAVIIAGTVSSEVAGLDVSVTVSVAPATPANFAATANPQATGNEGDCGPAYVDRIDLTHDASGLGGSFGRYEYQRQEPDGTWATIATQDTAATVTRHDWEARLDTTESYRMRQVRTGDFVPSAWTATDTATAQAYGYETKIASNHYGAAVSYERGPDYETTYPVERSVVGRQGADGRWVQRQAEDQGEDFALDLLVHGGPPPAVGGRAVFEDLRDLLAADVPHFAICDADGDRIYGDATLTRTTRTELGGEAMYEAGVAVSETQLRPTPVTA